MKPWILISNGASASATSEGVWKTCEKILAEGGLQLECKLTAHPGHAIELAREAAVAGARRFIAVGGDGTVHEVMTGLLRYADATGTSMGEFTLAVIPSGTGNDWVRTPGIPQNIEEAARCILKGHTAKEDVVRATFQSGVYCMANIGGLGADADICHNTNALKKKGHKGSFLYTMVAPYSILSRKRRRAEIILDGQQVFKGRLFTATIGNGIYRGGGLTQTEAGSRWDDGLLEVSILGDVNHIKGLMVLLHCTTGDLAAQPEMISRRFHKMEVKPLDGPDRVEIDGELPGALPVTIELTGEQINIIVP